MGDVISSYFCARNQVIKLVFHEYKTPTLAL